jgi:hypothetical protein
MSKYNPDTELNIGGAKIYYLDSAKLAVNKEILDAYYQLVVRSSTWSNRVDSNRSDTDALDILMRVLRRVNRPIKLYGSTIYTNKVEHGSTHLDIDDVPMYLLKGRYTVYYGKSTQVQDVVVSLENGPIVVQDSVSIVSLVNNLKGSPLYVGKSFTTYNATSLEGAPLYIGQNAMIYGSKRDLSYFESLKNTYIGESLLLGNPDGDKIYSVRECMAIKDMLPLLQGDVEDIYDLSYFIN